MLEVDCHTRNGALILAETTRLSTKEQSLYFAVAAAAIQVRSEEDFKDWIRTEVRAFFPHGIMQAVAGTIQRGEPTVDHVISVGYRSDYLAEISTPAGKVESPIVNRWLKERKPQLFEPPGKEWSPSQTWLQTFEKFKLRNIASHGWIDVEERRGSYFTFSRIPGPLRLRHGYLLELIIPHLHRALMQAVVRSPMAGPSLQAHLKNLSDREKRVLWWITTGKTNTEIGRILGRSENTIRNQAHSIYKKLGVTNRTEAVAMAARFNKIK